MLIYMVQGVKLAVVLENHDLLLEQGSIRGIVEIHFMDSLFSIRVLFRDTKHLASRFKPFSTSILR